MESCGMTVIKYFLFVFNAIFVVLGILIIAATSYDISIAKEYNSGGEAYNIETDIFLIIIGILILVVAAFGCFGAIKESPKLLYLYAGSLILIIILELSVGIAAAVLRPQTETGMKKRLRESFIKNKADSGHKIFWDGLQQKLMCCGVIGPEDYTEVSTNAIVPPSSCCPMTASGSESTPAQATQAEANRRSLCVSSKNYYKTGCEDMILEAVHGAGIAVIVTGIVFCFLEVIGIILALWLAQSIKNEGKSDGATA